MRRLLVAVLVFACSGCGLLLDLGADPDEDDERRDAGIERDGSRGDSSTVLADGSRTFDATVADAAPVHDGSRVDATPVGDAGPVDSGLPDPAACRDVLDDSRVLGPGDSASESTCDLSLVDFACNAPGVMETYYRIDTTTGVTVTFDSPLAMEPFVLAQVDEATCASTPICDAETLTFGAGETVLLAVEKRSSGCGVYYTIEVTATP